MPPAKSKRAAKSKEILTDADDERLDKLPSVPAAKGKGKAREYIEISDDDEEASKEKKLPTIVVGKKMKKVSPSLHWIRSLPYLHPPVFLFNSSEEMVKKDFIGSGPYPTYILLSSSSTHLKRW